MVAHVANYHVDHLVPGAGHNLLGRTDFVFAHDVRAWTCGIHEEGLPLLRADDGNILFCGHNK